MDHRFQPYRQRGVFWYRPLAILSLAGMASEHHSKNNGGPDQWKRLSCKRSIPPFSLKVAEFYGGRCYVN